jgi:di/tripeptidase
MSEVVDRFLKYIKIDTESARASKTYPSTLKQLDLARLLRDELMEIGLQDVGLDEYGYVTATLPANIDKKVPVVGFLAHMDTSPDMSGKDVKPQSSLVPDIFDDGRHRCGPGERSQRFEKSSSPVEHEPVVFGT